MVNSRFSFLLPAALQVLHFLREAKIDLIELWIVQISVEKTVCGIEMYGCTALLAELAIVRHASERGWLETIEPVDTIARSLPCSVAFSAAAEAERFGEAPFLSF